MQHQQLCLKYSFQSFYLLMFWLLYSYDNDFPLADAFFFLLKSSALILLRIFDMIVQVRADRHGGQVVYYEGEMGAERKVRVLSPAGASGWYDVLYFEGEVSCVLASNCTVVASNCTVVASNCTSGSTPR